MTKEPDFLAIAKQVLIKMGISGYSGLEVTSASKYLKTWKVNFSFRRPVSIISTIGCYSYSEDEDAITGMWLDRTW